MHVPHLAKSTFARLAVLLFCISLLLPIVPHGVAQPASAAGAETVRRYAVHEVVFPYSSDGLANPWRDVNLEITLTRPDGSQLSLRGFYYGTDEWRWRIAPAEVGLWRWDAAMWPRLERGSSPLLQTSGTFYVDTSTEPGFLRAVKGDNSGWVFDSGEPFRPMGINDCIDDYDKSGSPHDNNWNTDTEIASPPEGGEGNIPLDTFVALYGKDGAGFNMFRWGDDNCAFSIIETITTTINGNVYRAKQSRWVDEMFTSFRAGGMRIFMSIFGFLPPFPQSPSKAELAAIGEYLDYVVARYGSMVDIWELANESRADGDWVRTVSTMLRSRDPYGHPISMSWERPDITEVDIAAPHWYEQEDETISDVRVSEMAATFRVFRKPIIFAEQGNRGVNWDPLSARRLRLRSWTAVFEGAGMLYWNLSFKKNYKLGIANIYLGPEERGYIKALQSYAKTLPSTMTRFKPSLVQEEDADPVRAYGLSGPSQIGVYFVHVLPRSTKTTRKIEVSIPFNGTARWRDAATGAVLKEQTVVPGRVTLQSPPFMVDLLLDIRIAGSNVDADPSRQIQVANVFLRLGPPSTQSVPAVAPVAPTPVPPSPTATPAPVAHVRKD